MTGCISTQAIRRQAPAREKLPRPAKASVFLPRRAKLTSEKKIERISFPIPSCAAYIQVYDIFADRKRRRRGSKPADPPNPFARFALNSFD